jgi:ABC-type polysaccharide transport system permease subunit
MERLESKLYFISKKEIFKAKRRKAFKSIRKIIFKLKLNIQVRVNQILRENKDMFRHADCQKTYLPHFLSQRATKSFLFKQGRWTNVV